jgi:amino acid adenylation domain-containing protein
MSGSNGVARRPGQLAAESERAQIAVWNRTRHPYPTAVPVGRLVAEQARRTPTAPAVIEGHAVLTYGELSKRATRLAHGLRALGVGPDVVVALVVERSALMVLGALGILDAGGAYAPLDPSYPSERLALTLHDLQPAVILTTATIADRLPNRRWPILMLDREASRIAAQPAEVPGGVDGGPTDLAYVIYTSGSSGRPKGVEVTQASLLNLVFWHRRAFAVTPADRATLQSSPGFDAAVWEVWPYLTAGASLEVVEETTRLDPERLRDWIVARGITISFQPTALAERLIALPWPARPALRVLLTGADTLHRHPSPALPFTLVNNYGPTESTVVATSGVVPPRPQPEGRPSIGRPVDNTEIHILDEHLLPVGIGVPGELYISGAGLARGYRHQRELTTRRFVPSPFNGHADARLYRTGDRARWRPDGEIEFLGRADEQIKVRGFRIEPDEIVAALNAHPAVAASAVVAREAAPDERTLVAYVVPATEAEPSPAALLDALRPTLPNYMLPTTFVRLAALPLTAHGKVDRAALPAPDADNTLRDDGWEPARTPVEQRLARILAGLLDVERVGARDNFFLLGGHSLLGTQVIARIRESFGVELSLRTLFDKPTVAALGVEIERAILAKLEPAA